MTRMHTHTHTCLDAHMHEHTLTHTSVSVNADETLIASTPGTGSRESVLALHWIEGGDNVAEQLLLVFDSKVIVWRARVRATCS